MASWRRVAIGLGIIAAVVMDPGVAIAHPLGDFTVNTAAAIEIGSNAIRVEYVVDMAEVPTFEERMTIDADGDGTMTAAERAAWAHRAATEVLANLDVSVDGQPAQLELTTASMTLQPGQAGLDTLRLSATYAGTVPSAGTLSFDDANYDGRLGWREVTAAGAATRIVRSTVPSTSPSRHLTAYPDDLIESPLDVTSATVEYAPGEGTLPGATPPESRNETGLALTGDGFTALATRQGTGLMLVAVLLAIAFGALHSLGPGHGKTIMAAYLVGSGGRIRHAVGVAAAIAAMHTASVLALGLIVLSAQRVFPPEVVYPWLALVSGVIALTLGTTLLITRVRARRPSGESTHGHTHLTAPGWSRGGMAGLALAGGILPSPTALLVLLGSVALGRTAFGLALIAGFSVGLAVALIGVGVLTLRTRDLVVRRSSTWLGRVIPVVSAAIVVVLGGALTFRGFTQI